MDRREKGRPWKKPSVKKDHMDSERAGQTLTLGILMNFTSEYRYLARAKGKPTAILFQISRRYQQSQSYGKRA
jgi:hypothetical protein